MQIDLSGKTALVTGSTAGIGRAIASGLAGAGAEVIVNGRPPSAPRPPPRRSPPRPTPPAGCAARRPTSAPPGDARR